MLRPRNTSVLVTMICLLGEDAKRFSEAAVRRRLAMERMWNGSMERYEPFNLRTGERVSALSAENTAPLFVGLVDADRAAQIARSLKTLFRKGGLMSSELTSSSHQWDGNNGWAPHQMMGVIGLNRYRESSRYPFGQDAKTLAWAWVSALSEIHSRSGTMYERIDVATATAPIDSDDKYPTQTGFLWTDTSFEWMLHFLDVEFKPIP